MIRECITAMYKNFYMAHWVDEAWHESPMMEVGEKIEELVAKCKTQCRSIRVRRLDVASGELHVTYCYISKGDSISYYRYQKELNSNKEIELKNVAPVSDDEAKMMLERLTKHFNCQVMPVNKYCDALRVWANCILDLYEETLSGHKQGSDYCEYLYRIITDIEKSNLLWRLIYNGEELRTEKCPKHEGRWSGYSFEGCVYGCGETGWLPN